VEERNGQLEEPGAKTMVLELHIWGPAFGLPSIDAQCLAAIAYFALAVPEKDVEWVVIADSDPLMVPTRMLPLWLQLARLIGRTRLIVPFFRRTPGGMDWREMDQRVSKHCGIFETVLKRRMGFGPVAGQAGEGGLYCVS
jgi:sorting and assembly machinery component 37